MKLKYDVTASDAGKATGSNFEKPTPGVYDARIDEITQKQSKSGNPMLEVVVEITGPKFVGSKVWDYIVLNENSLWKLDQFLQAFGIASTKKRKGTVDTDELLGETVKVRIKGETYNDEYSARLGAYMMSSDDDDDADDDSDDDIEESDRDEDEDDIEDVDEDEEPEDDYQDMTVPQLREELEQRDLVTNGAKPALIARLREDDGTGPY